MLVCPNVAKRWQRKAKLICARNPDPRWALVFRQTVLLKREGFVVRKSRFSLEQIVAVLKQAEMGMPVGAAQIFLALTPRHTRRTRETERRLMARKRPKSADFGA